jgi:hypothetical protein
MADVSAREQSGWSRLSLLDLAARSVDFSVDPEGGDHRMDTLKGEELRELKKRFDDVYLNVLGPIRLRKQVDREAMDELKAILDAIASKLSDEEYVPRKWVGDLWSIVTSMLAEAGHAKDPAPIINEAWAIIGKLEQIFGPDDE